MSVSAHHIVIAPIITEESQIQTRKAVQYTFRVAPSANKRQIAQAIEEIFPEVKVSRVNTMNYIGKTKRMLAQSRRVGRRAKWKKAVVTLREGDKIDLI